MAEPAVSGTKRLLRHSSIYALGSILKNLVGFIMLPLYTRYLSPADYGVISLMLFMLTLFELLFAARLGYALPKMWAEDTSDSGRKTLISTALIFMAAIGLASSTVVFAARVPLSQLIFGTTQYTTIVSYFSFMVLTQSLETHGFDYIRLQQRPWLFLGLGLSKLVVQLSLNVLFIVGLNQGVMGVALSTMLSSTVTGVVMLIYVVAKTGIRYDHPLAKRMLAFSWPLWFGGLAGLYIGSSNRYYMRIFGTMDHVGLYSLAERFSGIITMLIWGPFAQYWVVESFKYYQADKRAAFNIVFSIICGILFMAGLGIALFAPPTIHIMSQPAFYPAANAVPFLVMSTIFASLAQFVSFSFLVTETTKLLSAYSYLTAIVVSVLYVALIPALGHVGAALASSAAQGLQLLIQYRQGQRRYNMELSIGFLFFAWGVTTVAYLLGNFAAHDAGFFTDLAVRAVAWTAAAAIIVYRLLSDSSIRRHALDVSPGPVRSILLRLLPPIAATAKGPPLP
jgi:O-antigen/teichoic acid export membrane protein